MVWTKRARFILTSLLLTVGLLSTQFVNYSWRYQAIFILTVLASFLSWWVLAEELTGISWIACLILPSFFTSSVALFYFLLPEKLITRLVILTAFAVGIYAILLTENILSIAAGRSIQLLRAAQAVCFLMTLVTVFFFYDTIFSFKVSPVYNFLLIFTVSIGLYWQLLWSVNLNSYFQASLLYISLALSFLSALVGFSISFWPLAIWLSSLFVVTYFYIVIGLVQHDLARRLFANTVFEYLQVGLALLILTLFLARWGGI